MLVCGLQWVRSMQKKGWLQQSVPLRVFKPLRANYTGYFLTSSTTRFYRLHGGPSHWTALLQGCVWKKNNDNRLKQLTKTTVVHFWSKGCISYLYNFYHYYSNSPFSTFWSLIVASFGLSFSFEINLNFREIPSFNFDLLFLHVV